MIEPTYKIAQALHARRAAVGLKKYGQHLSADSPGCMLVHALEEAADQVNYLIAEIQRRKHLIETLYALAVEVIGYKCPVAFKIEQLADSLGGRAALAKYDEILGGGTVAQDATVAPEPTKPSAEQPELREYRFSRYVNGKLKAEGAVVMAMSDRHAAEKLTKLCCDHPAILIGGQVPTAPDPRDEALRVATEALEKIADDGVERSRDPRTLIARTALAAIRGAR